MTSHSPSPLWQRDLGFFLVAVLLIGLGTASATGLTGLDETIHSFRSAIETFQHGQWWAPTLEGEPRVSKPPLLYWLMGGSFSLFGISFFSGRLPVVLMGALLVLVTRQLARTLGRSDEVLVGWLALALFAVASESRRAMLDIPVALCTALAVLWSLQAWSKQQPWRLYLAALITAAGIMFKGPVILIFLAAAALAAWLAAPLPGLGLRARAWWGPLLLALALGAIWPLLTFVTQPDALLVLSDDVGDRQLGWPSLKSIGQALSACLAIALPWSFVLLVGGVAALTKRAWPTEPALRWLLLWLALALLPFMFVRTFERYLVPLIPVVVILVAQLLAEPRLLSRRFGLVLAALLLAIPTLAFAALAWRFEHIWLLPALSVACWVAVAVYAVRAAPLRMAQAAAVTLALVLGGVYPRLGISNLPADFNTLLGGLEVRHYLQPHPGVASIHLQRSVPVLGANEQLRGFDGALIVAAADWPGLQAYAQSAELDVQELRRFRSFHARTQFIRFTRPGVRREDWLEAFRSGDWESLKPEFVLVRIRPAPPAAPPAAPSPSLTHLELSPCPTSA